MTEPISVRTEAINTLRTALNLSTSGSSESDDISAGLSVTNSAVTSMNTSLVDLKNDVALLRAQLRAVASGLATDIDTITLEDPDAATEEELAGTDPSVVPYSVEAGTLNTTYFKSDSTHYIKHYIYDNLHVLQYSLGISSQIARLTTVKVASFTDLSTCPDKENPGGSSIRSNGHFTISGNNLMFSTWGSSIGTDDVMRGIIFWFDRSKTSKLFTFEDGAILSSNFLTSGASCYAVHAYTGNLHFLTIHTQTLAVKQRDDNDYDVAEFITNMSIPNAMMMGTAYGHVSDIKTDRFHFPIKATDNKTIAITCYGWNASVYLAIDVIWIDQRATSPLTTITNGTCPVFSSTDKYCKYLKYGRFNVIQSYGGTDEPITSSSSSLVVAKFDTAITCPDILPPPLYRPVKVYTSSSEVSVAKEGYYTFKINDTLSQASSFPAGRHVWTYLWFA